MLPRAPDRRDEHRHRSPDEGVGWSETFVLAVASPAAWCSIRTTVHPFERRVAYAAVVVRPGEPIVAVIDDAVPLPPSDRSLELRTDGLWADQNVETPFDHVSAGLEAFGLAVDDPEDLSGPGFGLRTPVGADLEWESTGPPIGLGSPGEGYALSCRAHGELLVGADALDLDGPGHRLHRWGVLDGWVERAELAVAWEDGTFDVTDPGPDVGHRVLGWAPVADRSVGPRRARHTTAAVELTRSDGVAGVGWLDRVEITTHGTET